MRDTLVLSSGAILALLGATAVVSWVAKFDRPVQYFSAKHLRINYREDPRQPFKTLTLSDPAQVQAMVAKAKVTSLEKGLFAGRIPMLQVVFVREDGSMIEAQFLGPAEMDVSYVGRVRLADGAFHEAIRQAIREHEAAKP